MDEAKELFETPGDYIIIPPYAFTTNQYGITSPKQSSKFGPVIDEKAYKLEDVTFNIPKDEKGKYKLMDKWTFTSKDGSINLEFTPIIDRKDCTDILVIKSLQHQVFGRFNGKIKIGEIEAEITDAISFAEVVTNWW